MQIFQIIRLIKMRNYPLVSILIPSETTMVTERIFVDRSMGIFIISHVSPLFFLTCYCHHPLFFVFLFGSTVASLNAGQHCSKRFVRLNCTVADHTVGCAVTVTERFISLLEEGQRCHRGLAKTVFSQTETELDLLLWRSRGCMLQGWVQDIFSFKSVCVCVFGGGATGPALNSNRNIYCDIKITTHFRNPVMQIRSDVISQMI